MRRRAAAGLHNTDPSQTHQSPSALQRIRTGLVVCARKQAVVNTIKDQAASADVAENKHLRARALNERAERICCGCLEVYVAVLLPWCNGQDVMSPNPLRSPHNVHQRSLCLCSSVKHIPRFHSSVCRADEPSPRGAGRTGCHGLQVRADRGKAAILLPGGPTVLCDQAAHQLSLQGDGGHTRGARLCTFVPSEVWFHEEKPRHDKILQPNSSPSCQNCASDSYAAVGFSRCESCCPRSCHLGSSLVLSPPNCRSAP